MINSSSRFRLLCLALATSSTALFAQQADVLKIGSFDAAGRGWQVTDKGRTMFIKQGGQAFLRLVRKDQGTVMVQVDLPVEPEWSEIVTRVRMRATALNSGSNIWENARVQMVFLDQTGQRAGNWPAVPSLAKEADWTQLEVRNKIPPGARTLRVQPAMMNCTGVADFDEIEILPIVPGQLPAGEKTHWGLEPDEKPAPGRGLICLNGWWRFAPAAKTDKIPFGWIRVPGSWSPSGNWQYAAVSQMVTNKGPGWNVDDFRKVDRAWYDRPIDIPADWAGRSVLLELTRVSTDAKVYLDGKQVGQVTWPEGTVDLTAHVKPGRRHNLRLLVAAVPDPGKVRVYMESATQQVSQTDSFLQSRGLIGDVLLTSRPRGAHIESVFVRTSVAGKTLGLDIDLAGVDRAGAVDITAEMLGPDGGVTKSFQGRSKARAADRQTISLQWPWADAKLWELDDPYLYTCRLRVAGEGVIEDAFAQRFGFREFNVDGRHFTLNGKRIRLRPWLMQEHAMAELIDAEIDWVRDMGFNLAELWPWDHDQRGKYLSRRWIAQRADEKGFLLTGVLPSVNDAARNWQDDAVSSGWQQRVRREWKHYRNHPSMLMWAVSANYFGNDQDQNPRNIGMRGWADDNTAWVAHARKGQAACDFVRSLDPTRPVFTHQGAYVGDVHTANMYLNFIPLQEREQWFSHWAEKGQMPFLAVEYEMPINLTMRRARTGHANADKSEPWVTEFAASWLGEHAYRVEEGSYRRGIIEAYRGEDRWQFRQPEIHDQAAFQAMVAEHTRRLWRSIRTWGLSGGALPWNSGHALVELTAANELVDAPAFEPGRRGSYWPRVQRGLLEKGSSTTHELTPAGRAFQEVMTDTLAWIAGNDGQFTEKSHNFAPGQVVQKQVVLINDSLGPQKYQVFWQGLAAAEVLGTQRLSGELAAGQIRKLAIQLPMPASLPGRRRAEGTIKLTARIGQETHEDAFAFTVHPPAEPKVATVALHDPAGLTGKMLGRLGVETKPAPRGRLDVASMPLLVIGRQALAEGRLWPAGLEAYVRAGGRVLVMAQRPADLAGRMGFRVSGHVQRRVFAVDPDHAVLAGLDEKDLRDWAGAGTLVEPYPQEQPMGPHGKPYYGWRWGTDGSVSSAAIEKPHRSGWTPILQCGFDLQYTPLMELSLGKGRVILCQLDLEDAVGQDAAAVRLAANLLDYAASEPLRPVGQAEFSGSHEGAKLLDSLGVVYKSTDKPSARGLLLTDDPARFGQHAGPLVVLPQVDPAAWKGVLGKVDRFDGSLTRPHGAMGRGLAASDLRTRVPVESVLIDRAARTLEVAADGLLARRRLAGPEHWVAQLDPRRFETQARPYLRFTRWRTTRALAQVLANAGCTFAADAEVFTLRNLSDYRVSLAGRWQMRTTLSLPAAEHHGKMTPDPGMTDLAKRLIDGTENTPQYKPVDVPYGSGKLTGPFGNTDGEAVYRLAVTVPAGWKGEDLQLHLGKIDDSDMTFFNGRQVGAKAGWNDLRQYTIPAELVKPGQENIIHVRVFDQYLGGGLYGPAEKMWLVRGLLPKRQSWYHPDYRDPFEWGDDPYRYYRW
ncbi:MAG: sugar-binding domain-containing protein [Planctomycetota bacterium]